VENPLLNQDQMAEALRRARTIAVVGLSDNPDRPSYGIAGFLQQRGYRVIPVNPNLSGPVLGQQPVASLRDIAEHVDIVNVFRRPQYAAGVVEDALAIGADLVWMQPGTASREAVARAEKAGIGVVADACIAVMHRLLLH
jgi:predicted CoA-binding protein